MQLARACKSQIHNSKCENKDHNQTQTFRQKMEELRSPVYLKDDVEEAIVAEILQAGHENSIVIFVVVLSCTGEEIQVAESTGV